MNIAFVVKDQSAMASRRTSMLARGGALSQVPGVIAEPAPGSADFHLSAMIDHVRAFVPSATHRTDVDALALRLAVTRLKAGGTK